MGCTSHQKIILMPMANHARKHIPMVHRRSPSTKEQQATLTYANYLNYIQTKDKKYIHPPLNITNLRTYMQECKPDKDILTNKSTIQIQGLDSHIYDHNGKYITTITTERLQWLWNHFSHNNPTHIINFLHKTLRQKYYGSSKNT